MSSHAAADDAAVDNAVDSDGDGDGDGRNLAMGCSHDGDTYHPKLPGILVR